MSELYRVQDKNGRGPWRPGYSHTWVFSDRDAPSLLPAIYQELPTFKQMVTFAHSMGLHIGVAVRGIDALQKWFMPDELAKLRKDGFRVVQCDNCRVLAETPNQVLIASKAPLFCLPEIPWRSVSKAFSEAA